MCRVRDGGPRFWNLHSAKRDRKSPPLLVHNLVNRGGHPPIGIPRIHGTKGSFFERTAGAARQKSRDGPRDNPGRPGNDRVRLVDPVPLRGGLPSVRGQHSPVPRVTVARHLKRLRNCAVRGDKKPLRTGSVPRTGFGSGSVAVTQRVHGCYCEPARVRRLWRAILQPMRARRKPSKDGTKGAAPPRGAMPWQGIFLRNAGDASAPLAGEIKAA